jgi:YVTN family beta-propeller protein
VTIDTGAADRVPGVSKTPSLLAVTLAAVALSAPTAAGAAPSAGWVQRLQATEAFQAPAGARPAQIDRAGTTVLPNGRMIRPAGPTVEVAPHPFGLVLSPDGQTVATANSGTSPFSVSLVDTSGDHPLVRQIPPGHSTDSGVLNAVFMGLAYAPDGKTLYVSGGNDGTIVALDPVTGTRQRTIDLNTPFGGREWRDGYIGDLRLSPDAKTLYALDQANFRLVAVDVATGTVTSVLPTGRYPFGLALSPDGRRAYVANVGMFAYSFVDGFDPANPQTTALPFPAFAAGTPEARDGTTTSDGIHVPGLGDPNDERAFSLWTLDLRTGRRLGALKTGPLVGERVAGLPAVGGSSPNSVVTDGRYVYVSNNASDTVAVVDADGGRLVATVPLTPTRELGSLRGDMPFGLALSPAGDRLYVAESGINAVAVIETAGRTVLGHIPVGWFPSKLAVSADGRRLYVANAKGFGSGPNAGPGYDPSRGDQYVGSLMHGSVTRVELPDTGTERGAGQLRRWTEQVLAYNGFAPRDNGQNGPDGGAGQGGATVARAAARRSGSPIKHVIFVTKENRTFDQVLGDLGTVGGKAVHGDPSLANAPGMGFGEHATVIYGDGRTEANVNVTPNHHALARQFAVSDNAYVDSDVSSDGHRWLVGVAPNQFAETSVAATYGGRQDFRIDQTPDAAVGRRGFFESNSSLQPEDYPEAGSIWDGFARAGTTFRNYGEGYEQAGIYEGQGMEPTGARLPVNIPMPGPLLANTDRSFPTYNLNISEQYRYEEFAREFRSKYVNGGEDLPQFTNVYFPVDHTAWPQPWRGYPAAASYVADNDYALGRLVDLVSHSKYWASTAIVVTEDDSQSGVDTVDAHRTIQLVISPWARHAYVSHDHTSIASITKTINLLTGTPYLNQFDAAATSLLGSFTDKPDFTPFDARQPDARVYQPQSAAAARARPGVPGPKSPEMDDPAQMHENLLRMLMAARRRSGR